MVSNAVLGENDVLTVDAVDAKRYKGLSNTITMAF